MNTVLENRTHREIKGKHHLRKKKREQKLQEKNESKGLSLTTLIKHTSFDPT